MIISMEVAALFSVEDRATEPLNAIAAGMEKIVDLGTQARAALQEISSVTLSAATAGVEGLATALGGLKAAAASVAEGMAAVGTTTATAARTAAESVDTISAAWTRAAEAQERFRQAVERPMIAPPTYDGVIGGPDIVPYGGYSAASYRRPEGPIIDHEPGIGGFLGWEGAALASGAATGGGGYGAPMVMAPGFGRGQWRNQQPGPGGFRNVYGDPESGPTIQMGSEDPWGPISGDESLRIPAPPGGWDAPPGGWGRGGGGGGAAAAGAAAGGGGSGRRGGLHFGLLNLIEGAAVYDAMHSSMSEEASLFNAMQRGFHLDPTDSQNADVMAQLRAAAHAAAQGTSFSESEVAGGMATLAAPLGMRGRAGVAQFMPVFEQAAKIAEAAKQTGIGNYEDTLAASVEYAHQTGTYDPQKLNERLNNLFAITSALPETTLSAQARIMSYVVPEANALGVDPTEAADATGFLERAGLRGTKAGTTLRQFMLGNMKGGGPLNAHMESARNTLSRELSLDPEGAHALRAMSTSAHEGALKDLGIIDQQGHNVTSGANGNYDLNAGLEAISRAARRLTREQFGHDMYLAYGVRGEDADLLAENPQRFQDFVKDVSPYDARTNPGGTISAQEQLRRLSQTGQQEAGQAVARFGDTLNILGTSIMGGVKPALEALTYTLTGLNNALNSHPAVATGVAAAGIGAAGVSLFEGGLGYFAGGARAGLRRVLSWPLRYARNIGGRGAAVGSGGGGLGAPLAEEETLAAEAGEGGMGLGMMALPALAEMLLLEGANIGVDAGGAVGSQAAVRGGHTGIGRWMYDNSSALRYLDNYIHGTGAARSGTVPGSATPAVAASGGPGGASISIHIGPITLNGVGNDIKPMVERLFHEMAEHLAQSLAHGSGPGFGSLGSAFTHGAPP